jgi:hypothetical protein
MRYNTYHLRNLHTPMMLARRGGLRGLLGLGALSLQTDKPVYRAGETRTFQITGGAPDSEVRWTYYKDGVNLGYEQFLDQHLDSSGNFAWSGPLPADYAGFWQQEAIITNPADGSTSVAQTFFRVLPADAPDPNAPIPEPGPEPVTPGFFNQTIEILGQQIPTWALLGGAVFLLFTFRKGGR